MGLVVEPISTRTASRTCVSTRCLTELSMVAEKNNVWRAAGMVAMMRLMVGRKPISSMRSASSSTRMRTPPRAMSPRLRKSYNLPGVAITTCTPLRMDCNCDPSPTPPITTVARTVLPAAILTKVSWICRASSRVGLSMTARTPERAGSLASRWMMGRTNASVLPVPVCAVATTSRPASAGSMAWDWTGVGSLKPFFNRLLCRRAERGNSEKLFIFEFCGGESTSRLPNGGRGVVDQLPVDLSIAHLGAWQVMALSRRRAGAGDDLAPSRAASAERRGQTIRQLAAENHLHKIHLHVCTKSLTISQAGTIIDLAALIDHDRDAALVAAAAQPETCSLSTRVCIRANALGLGRHLANAPRSQLRVVPG